MVAKSNPATTENASNGVMDNSMTPFYAMLHAMETVATAEAESQNFSGDDLNQILSAETEEEIWDADERGPINFQHLAGCEIEIIDFSVKYGRGSDSAIQTPFVASDGRKLYLLVKCARLSKQQENKILNLPSVGEVFEANTSARFVVAKLWAFASKGHIDPQTRRTLKCRVQSTDLGDGKAVVKLRPIGSASVTASVE